MNPQQKETLIAYLTGIADDELVLGQRDSEWCGHAPILEEDIAFANIALDEIGHALVWYGIVADLTGESPETYPDQLAYHRNIDDFLCAQLVELPKGDWAFTMIRQYLFDLAETTRLKALSTSTYTPIAEAASKIVKEEIYHLRHTRMWVKRLGMGTDESNTRMQAAIDAIWPYARQLFVPVPGEDHLVKAGLVSASEELATEWQQQIEDWLRESNLKLPENISSPINSRKAHSEHLSKLLEDLQSVARLDPRAIW